MRRLLKPLAFALAVVVVAALCLASPYLAGVVGLLTAAVVAVDMIAFSRGAPPPRLATSSEPTPETINVDLRRRP